MNRFVPTTMVVQMGARAYWPACMAHVMMNSIRKVVCV